MDNQLHSLPISQPVVRALTDLTLTIRRPPPLNSANEGGEYGYGPYGYGYGGGDDAYGYGYGQFK